MSWFNVWDTLKNKTCRYLLQRYLGQFLEEKLNLEQLNIELYNGKAMVKDVALKVEAINELFEMQGCAFELIEGRIGTLTVTVPWNALMTNDSFIEISDLYVSLRPIKRKTDGTSMVESMWSSVSSSMQLAEECMNQDFNKDQSCENQNNSIIGLEKFAETIDNVLNRINARCHNTIIRFEYASQNRSKGIAIVCKIENFSYKNETGCKQTENTNQSALSEDANASPHMIYISSFAKHNIIFSGVKFYTEEFKNSQQIGSYDNHNVKQIPILDVKGQQKMQIRMKQSEEVLGPKVCLDIEIGSIYSLLTPRQIHLLLKLYQAFQEEGVDDSRIDMEKENKDVSSKNDPMQQSVYMTGVLGNNGTWADHNDVYTEQNSDRYISKYTDMAEDNYCESLSSSVSTSTCSIGMTKYQRKMANFDACCDILNFNVKVASLYLLLLHEDVIQENNTNTFPTENSLQSMSTIADTFFDALPNEPAIKQTAIKKNHLILFVSPITAQGFQQRNRKTLIAQHTLTASRVDLSEFLDGKEIPLVVFDRNKNGMEDYPTQPEVVVTVKSSGSGDMKDHAYIALNIVLEQSVVDLDISIYDRLSSLFAMSPFENMHWNKASIHENVPLKSKIVINVNVIAEKMNLILRFPIIDARPMSDGNRIPWWKQNIRADYLYITWTNFNASYNAQAFEIITDAINIFYCENNTSEKVHILKTHYVHSAVNKLDPEYPRITIKSMEPANVEIPQKKCETHDSTEESICVNTDINSPRGPFSSKRECRQSDTINPKRDNTEPEAILLPGESEELNEFCNTSIKNSKLHLEISLPALQIELESKQLYEIIYNRLNNDLFMWEPSSPVFNVSNVAANDPLNIGLNDSLYVPSNPMSSHSFFEQQRYSCASQVLIDTDDNIFSENDTSFRSFKSFSNSQIQQSTDRFSWTLHNNCTVEILIQRGSMSLYLPVRDADNHVIPAQLGHILLELRNANIFFVNGYKSDANLGYLCLRLDDVDVCHCGLIPLGSVPTMQFDFINIKEFGQPTFYKLPNDLTKGKRLWNTKRDMISIVLELKKDPQQHVKRLKMATGVQNIALRYNPSTSSFSWLNQLMDFLDVTDYPIEGYNPFSVITEVQLHFWDCAIDYRPKKLPYRAVVELGTFTLSSNIISAVKASNLRFVIEESLLSIAPYKNGCNDINRIAITSKPLVPVLDIGLIDISLRLSEIIAEKIPKFDLRCSIHDVHLRTCADSGCALAQLIAYIANDGDIPNADDTERNNDIFEQSSNSDVDLFVNANDNIPQMISKQQQDHVNLMMAEAVQETETHSKEMISEKSNTNSIHDINSFYFPDEEIKTPSKTQQKVEISNSVNYESGMIASSNEQTERGEFSTEVQADLGIYSLDMESNHNESESEDEFCIIADDEKAFMAHCGIKDYKLADDPIRIVDNHFCLPISKSDLLRSPESFPTAVSRYTLCEMTVTWHLYGGKDFSMNETISHTNRNGEEPHMSKAYKHGVSRFKSSQGIRPIKKPKEKITWKSEGGPYRNHEVLVEIQLSKVRFSHEVYSKTTAHASRQVFLVSEIEIRDRLQSSDINKFLYYPNIKHHSKKTTHNTLLIKALHIRPNSKELLTQECSLRISLLPMRLHIDQDTLIFLCDFFSNISEFCNDSHTAEKKKFTKPAPHPPVMTVDEVPNSIQDLQARKLVTTNLELLMDAESTKGDPLDECEKLSCTSNEEPSPIYFREVIFSPEVSIRFDYHGRRVDLSRGPIAGLLMGLGQLQCSEIILRKIEYRRGILGLDKLITFLCKEWLKDIKTNQLQKILSGVGPTHAFVQLFHGIYDLFWLPIEQYQKDGRLIRGIQLGAQSFTARTALAALEITSRIIQILQFTAETAFDLVSPGPTVRISRKMRKGRKRPNRPTDIREGVTNAYMILKDGINESANNLIETAIAQHDQKGYTGAVGAVVRQIPQLVVCPAVLATQATTNILGGVKSSLLPEAKLEAREKWKDETDL